jgi:hypothetical protein
VDERKPPARLEDLRLGQSVRGPRGLAVVEAGKLRCKGRLGRVAEHGDGPSEEGAAGWQAPQTSAHGPADAVRAQLAGQACILAIRRDLSPVQLAEQLPEQERVAAVARWQAVTKPGSGSAASSRSASMVIARSLSPRG